MTRGQVFLHIGEPKCGTTFLQELMWRHRDQLADHGVMLPGTSIHDHYRAQQDLRNAEQAPDDPGARWAGAWAALAKEARTTSGTAVISHELTIGADDEQAAHAVETLAPAEVHVVITARDLAGLLPAEWQETVKHRNARTWQEWLADIIDTPPRQRRPRAKWFWAAHDTAVVAKRWSALVTPQRVHLVTVPRSPAPPDLLWHRFAGVLGVTGVDLDLSVARANASLGVAEVELLRRINERLPDLPQWFYGRHVKNNLAHGLLSERPKGARLQVPVERREWVREQSARRIRRLRRLGIDIVGELDDLAAPVEFASGTTPEAIGDHEVLDAALFVLAATIERRYHRVTGAAGLRRIVSDAAPDLLRGSTVARRLALAVRRHRA